MTTLTQARRSIVLDRKRENIVELLGPEIGGWLREPDVTDVICNPPLPGEALCRLWVARLGRDRECVGTMEPEQAIRLIGAVAASMGKELTTDTPSVAGILITDGCRFQGCGPPISEPFFAIRKPASAVFPYEQYVAEGKMTEAQRDILEDAIARRLNGLIVGSTGSGKSTLLNATIDGMQRITPKHRYFIIEDQPELQCTANDLTRMRTSPTVSTRDLVFIAMRSFADRLLIGETRDGVTMLEALKAANTGHPGAWTTLHSDISTPERALERVEDLLLEVVPNPMSRMIARTVNLIVCIQSESGIRRVTQVASVHGHDGRNYQLKQEA